MKKFAISLRFGGAVVVYAKTKKEAHGAFRDKGYEVSLSDIYLY